MTEPTTFDQSDDEAITKLLVGRRITAAEEGNFPVNRWTTATGRLILDDGTELLVYPNEGCGGCPNGRYSLEKLAAVDNIITSVRLTDEKPPPDEDGYVGEDAHAYRIYVVADAVEVNVLSVEGDNGNGYYGGGYELVVVPSSLMVTGDGDNR